MKDDDFQERLLEELKEQFERKRPAIPEIPLPKNEPIASFDYYPLSLTVLGLLTLTVISYGVFLHHRKKPSTVPVISRYELKIHKNEDGEIEGNSVVRGDRVIYDYKNRPLLNVEVRDDGVLLFSGQPIMVEAADILQTLDGEKVYYDQESNDYQTAGGNFYRKLSPPSSNFFRRN